jgi:hypothetical protein
MTLDKLIELFKTHHDKYLEEDSVNFTITKRADLHAFLLLDKLVPGKTDLISASEHDVYYLDIGLEELAEVINEEQIIELIACGVMLNSEYDCLSMFS